MIKLGIITRTRDNDGTVFVDSSMKLTGEFVEEAEVYIGFSEKFTKQFILEKSGKSGKGFLMKIKELNSSEEAIKFKEQAVFIEESSIRQKEKLHSLTEYEGFKAINKRTNEVIGIIVEELELPAHNILVVKSADKEFLIPVVPDFIESVNKRLRVIKINVIDGLLNDIDE